MFFRGLKEAFLKFWRFECQWLQMDVLTSPQRRFCAHGSRARAFDRPDAVGRMVPREVQLCGLLPIICAVDDR